MSKPLSPSELFGLVLADDVKRQLDHLIFELAKTEVRLRKANLQWRHRPDYIVGMTKKEVLSLDDDGGDTDYKHLLRRLTTLERTKSTLLRQVTEMAVLWRESLPFHKGAQK